MTYFILLRANSLYDGAIFENIVKFEPDLHVKQGLLDRYKIMLFVKYISMHPIGPILGSVRQLSIKSSICFPNFSHT
jgi:hypothetical protein